METNRTSAARKDGRTEKKMSVKIESENRTVVAYLEGEIDHHTAPEMRAAIDEAIEKNMPSCLVLDFGGVGFMDSSGIGLIMGRYKAARKYGGEVHIMNASPQLAKVMRISGIKKLAKID